MKKPSQIVCLLSFALVACDASMEQGTGDQTSRCPIGTFQPDGIDECVFPADTMFSGPYATSDNRCATGQPAYPPRCVGENGLRPYLSLSSSCAPGYRFEAGLCGHDNVVIGGVAGAFGGGFGVAGAGTAGAGTAGAGEFGVAGASGTAGLGAAGAGAGGGGGGGQAGEAEAGFNGAAGAP
jgi:hypothetical protein